MEHNNDPTNNGVYYDMESAKPQTKAELERMKYIRKEQANRAKQLEEENKDFLLHSSKMAAHRIPTISDQASDVGTVNGFDPEDWTAQDSSYGAAFPFCGWIPKRIREAIERCMLVVAFVFIIYLVVKISITLSSSSSSSYKDNGDDENSYKKYYGYYDYENIDDDDDYNDDGRRRWKF